MILKEIRNKYLYTLIVVQFRKTQMTSLIDLDSDTADNSNKKMSDEEL